MQNINRRDIQFMLNRMYKKDVANHLNISPSTLYSWMKKDDKGNYVRKQLKSKRDHSSVIKTFKEEFKKTKTNKTPKEKETFNNDRIEGSKYNKEEFKSTEHYIYKFSGLHEELIRMKIAAIIDDNINNGINRTVFFIRMEVVKQDVYITGTKGEKIKATIQTPNFIAHKFIKETKEDKIFHGNIDELFIRANKLKYADYELTKILKVFLIEKHRT